MIASDESTGRGVNGERISAQDTNKGLQQRACRAASTLPYTRLTMPGSEPPVRVRSCEGEELDGRAREEANAAVAAARPSAETASVPLARDITPARNWGLGYHVRANFPP